MMTEFLNGHIPRRMAALGFPNWQTKHETIRIGPNETKVLKLWNTWAWVPSESILRTTNMTIESNFGVLQSISNDFNQVQYEHTGKVVITNHGPQPFKLSMILAIPYNH